MRKLLSLGGLCMLFCITACGAGKDAHLPVVFSKDYVLKEDSGLTISPNSLDGSGFVAFNDPITPAAKDARNIALNLSLEQGGSLTVYAFANQDLQHGIELSFTRVNDQLMSLSYENTAGELTSVDIATQNPDDYLPLSFDIHNQATPSGSRILGWDDADAAPDSSDAYLLDDTEAKPGVGTFLALRLDRAHVTGLKLAAPKSAIE